MARTDRSEETGRDARRERRRSAAVGAGFRWAVAIAIAAEGAVVAWGVRNARAANERATTAQPAPHAAGAPKTAGAAPVGGASGNGPVATTAVASVAVDARERPAASDVRSLLSSITRRQAELAEREKELVAREERLQGYERDVTQKLQQLEDIEKRLKAGAAAGPNDKVAVSLAKVYAAMRPAEAAPILEQMDDATVLRILGEMKEKQIGQILPLMGRDRAIVLTRSLVSRH
ncbi:MAG TPA: hypothetical protein VFD92_25555 [Candidatus Binatia bacterium]|nr:hypothetical protein [Candidatus Binatia bacterium]